jgi:hypothetical protein
MRIYLVIMDETTQSATALRFASRRAAKTQGNVHILALVPPQPFVAFGGVQATIEAEARERAETLLTAAAGDVLSAVGAMPVICVVEGEPIKVIRHYLAEHPEIAALVLGAHDGSAPGPLVSHFAGQGLGSLPCPLFIVPAGLSEEDIDRLS